MNHNQYVEIFIMLIISGLLSTKNVWVDSISDIRYSINDLYKILLTSGWMGSLMGFYYRDNKILSYGLILVIITIICIRTQFLVSENQYILDMIPHNSMTIHMSKERLNKNNKLPKPKQKRISTDKPRLKQILQSIINQPK